MLRIAPRTIVVFALMTLTACSLVGYESASLSSWETVAAEGAPTARHEAALVAFDEKLYLIGGRRINPVDVFDPVTRTWEARSRSPIELHHFQPVVIDDAIPEERRRGGHGFNLGQKADVRSLSTWTDRLVDWLIESEIAVAPDDQGFD